MKIELPLPELMHEKYEDVVESWIELRENSIRRKVSFYAIHPHNKEDMALGWKEQSEYTDIDEIALKERIVGFGKTYISKANLWQVYIAIDGFSQDIDVYFKKEAAATDLFDRMDEYLNQKLK